MRSRRLTSVLLLVGVAACYTPPEGPAAERVGAVEQTALVLQAVDAGTGSALTDAEMTVRYLVRKPIIFDASRVERVSSLAPYQIEHPVGDPDLVVEVRLEADSYHRLDTVLSVPKGSEAGPRALPPGRGPGRLARGLFPEDRRETAEAPSWWGQRGWRGPATSWRYVVRRRKLRGRPPDGMPLRAQQGAHESPGLRA